MSEKGEIEETVEIGEQVRGGEGFVGSGDAVRLEGELGQLGLEAGVEGGGGGGGQFEDVVAVDAWEGEERV